jgi:hypothetical protein
MAISYTPDTLRTRVRWWIHRRRHFILECSKQFALGLAQGISLGFALSGVGIFIWHIFHFLKIGGAM